MSEKQDVGENEELKQIAEIRPELFPDRDKEFYSSPCSMREFEEEEE